MEAKKGLQASKKAKRKIPERKCIGCGEGKSKQELLRIGSLAGYDRLTRQNRKKIRTGSLYMSEGRMSEKGRKSRRLEKNLACEISNEIYDAIEAELSRNE